MISNTRPSSSPLPATKQGAHNHRIKTYEAGEMYMSENIHLLPIRSSRHTAVCKYRIASSII